ncbi:M48 family metallopeptidase [bacterium]|nr:M48 family metallopeptidase [bacterium]
MFPTRRLVPFAALLGLCLFLSACATVPVTGRRQLNFIPDSQINAMSFQQYDEVIAQSTLSDHAEWTAGIERVGRRIQGAVEEYFRRQGQSGELAGYEWEFNLIESKEANAWCMPGGKVAFYTGILPICKDETGVAVVMGHEVAHAIAKHGSERMSQGLVLQMGGMALSEAVKNKPAQTRNLFMTAFAVGAQFGAVLPYSRSHESEADRMGLIFMALAGYDPREAPAFWERMAAEGGGSPPEFMSTHPSHETRIRELHENMAEAMGYYQPR